MNTTTQQPRSPLIGVFGWVMLVAGILGFLLSGVNLAIFSLISDQIDSELVPPEEMPVRPALFNQVLENMSLILWVLVFSALLMAVAGFGVIRRLEWGRKLSIALLAVSIVWGFVAAFAGLHGGSESSDVSIAAQVMGIVFNFGLALVTAALHGWIIWKLNSPEVRREFGGSLPESHHQ